MSNEVQTIVSGDPDKEPSEKDVAFESIGACFDDMSDEDQQAVVESVGSLAKVKSNPGLNDCR